MNITVVTPYDSSNFGAFLQAYCLNCYLQNLGHHVTFIPTRQEDYVESLYFTRKPATKKEKLFPPVYKTHLAFGKRKYEIFREAQKAFHVTEDFSATDLIVLGSDEIWNVKKDVFNAAIFWGSFDIPSISYAASIGDAPEDTFEYFPDQIDQLKRLRRALVRDENTKRVIEKYTDQKADLVCDPTILWSTDLYGEECSDEYVRTHDCLLVYSYAVSKKEKKEILKYARAKKLKVVTCCFYHGWSDYQVECSPLAFSDLIRKCRLFYTSSFHGTVFGMLNHANMVVSSDNPKTLHLIRQFGLENRLLSKKEMSADGLAQIYATRFSFKMADKKVYEWRNHSGNLLQEAIMQEAGKESAGDKPDPLICFHNQCTGCFACKSVCREGAISVKVDTQGRTLPEIDLEKCTGCGACRRICPQRNKPAFHKPLECYAARGKDSEVIRRSSSGGISAILVASFVRNKNLVCGSVIDNNRVEHRIVRDEKELSLLQGSKYVQSDISDLYDEIRQELRSGKEVLFFGTPCQVDAMNTFFGKNKNYYSVDIICHGVPPMEFLDHHLQQVTEGKAFDLFRFRGSPDDYTLKVFNEGELLYSKSDIEDTYFYAFMNCLICRENCYNCRYARADRVGDLTIGDFWGIDTKSLKNTYDGNISVVLVNTEKGRELFKSIRTQLVCERRETEEAVRGNPQLRKPSSRHVDRAKFLRAYMESRDFEQAVAATGIEKSMKRMQFGRTVPGKVYVYMKKKWQGR